MTRLHAANNLARCSNNYQQTKQLQCCPCRVTVVDQALWPALCRHLGHILSRQGVKCHHMSAPGQQVSSGWPICACWQLSRRGTAAGADCARLLPGGCAGDGAAGAQHRRAGLGAQRRMHVSHVAALVADHAPLHGHLRMSALVHV